MKQLSKFLSILCILFVSTATVAQAQTSDSAIHWGFKKGYRGQPAEAGQMLEGLLDKYGAYYKGNSNKKVLYLTFDNGYENGYTEQILDVLKKEKVPATFFVTGHYLKSAPDLVKRMVNEGHIIGNHSWHHPDFSQVSDEKLAKELEMVKAETARLTGQKEMTFLRPPRGVFTERSLEKARELGYVHVFWSLAFIDWNTNSQKGWKYSYDNIMRQVHPGSIILLHSVSKDNADALEKVIQDLKTEGYDFRSLDDLILEDTFKDPMLY
ncbi:delta-lactam-biosynthetic de-N-acetylase [Bacillus sp. DNRA2]|uniref:delta-lactam-biosynthetic de-N-acetylase n=1 Tax=Bacillus sp. DNRA2 TaxID=2723053 RepID=UPI00145D2190|nr:delta-lactam-biosynthetic de-N-acetylase [Bacillus sp. DNRA2]NMD69776.1 delta-lactam-biosynthetic de-N-acetylase [Bacillus sp. DNRA2]